MVVLTFSGVSNSLSSGRRGDARGRYLSQYFIVINQQDFFGHRTSPDLIGATLSELASHGHHSDHSFLVILSTSVFGALYFKPGNKNRYYPTPGYF